MSYTQADEPTWLDRLPRIQSTSKSMSKSKADYESSTSLDETSGAFSPGTLGPIGIPGNFMLRRQKEKDNPSNPNSRASSIKSNSRRKRWDAGKGPGGPISQSAITPQRRYDYPDEDPSSQATSNEKGDDSPRKSSDSGSEVEDRNWNEKPMDQKPENEDRKPKGNRSQPTKDHTVEAFDEGDHMILEDEEGNILNEVVSHGETNEQRQQHITDAEEKLEKETSGEHSKGKHQPHAKNEGAAIEEALKHGLEHPSHPYRNLMKRIHDRGTHKDALPKPQPQRHHGPAHAYQYGNTIIVEDEDGEVVKKYDIPVPPRKRHNAEGHGDAAGPESVRGRLKRLGTWTGRHEPDFSPPDGASAEPQSEPDDMAKTKPKRKHRSARDDPDDGARFTVSSGGSRMSKADFINQFQALDPKARRKFVEESNVPENTKKHLLDVAKAPATRPEPFKPTSASSSTPGSKPAMTGQPHIQRPASHEDRPTGNNGLTLVDSNGQDIPYHDATDSLSHLSAQAPETGPSRQRHPARSTSNQDSIPTRDASPNQRTTLTRQESSLAAAGETNAERKRRMAALGEGGEETKDSDSEEDGRDRKPKKGHEPVREPDVRAGIRSPGIRFADSPAVSLGRVQWGEDVKGRGGRANK